MKKRIYRHRDSFALAFAAAVTFAWSFPQTMETGAGEGPTPSAVSDAALAGLLDAEAARSQGAWWLDGPAPEARLSYAPEHQRLVWRVGNTERQVLLDAETGEALEFEFQ